MTTIVPFRAGRAAPAPIKPQSFLYRFRTSHHITRHIISARMVEDIEPRDTYTHACRIYGETLHFLQTLKD